MKKFIEMIMILAVFAAINAADNAPDKQKEAGSKEDVHKQAGHVCINSIFMQTGQLEKQEKYDDAIKMLEDAKMKPEYEVHSIQIYISLQKLYDKTKQYDKNIALWNEGHKKSMAFDIDPAKEEFKPYLKLKGFKETAKKDQELKKTVLQQKKEECDDHAKDVKTVK